MMEASDVTGPMVLLLFPRIEPSSFVALAVSQSVKVNAHFRHGNEVLTARCYLHMHIFESQV